MPSLFSPLKIRNVTFPNRVVVSPLCMYSADEGYANDWHFAHLSTFARGKAGLVFNEATAVTPEGRITPQCLGIWSEQHASALKPITEFIQSMNCVAGIQLAHAGRKAATTAPFLGGGQPLIPSDPDYWNISGPSTEPVADGFQVPHEMTVDEIKDTKDAFVLAAQRAIDNGFQVIELHGAHGYLLHSFLSPLSNHRSDDYGGSLENRMRFSLEVSQAVRDAVGDGVPLFFRISAIDGPTEGWSMDDSVALACALKDHGIDVVDCSSGGVSGGPRFRIDDEGQPLKSSSAREPGFQVPFASRIRAETTLSSMAVGVIIDPHQANNIIESGQADLVALGREIMYDPFWPLHAAEKLGVDPDFELWPAQYKWAVDRRSQIKRLNS